MTDFIRMFSGNVIVNVFKSDAVIWCAAILRTPSSMFDKMLRLLKSQGSAMSRMIFVRQLLVARCDSLASSTNQCHQLGLTRTATNHVLFLGRRIHWIPRVFNRTLDPNCNSRAAATTCDVSSPISIGHYHDRTSRGARNSRNIKIATNDYVARRISNQISQQTLDVDFITSGGCADVSGQLTNCVLDVRTIQPE